MSRPHGPASLIGMIAIGVCLATLTGTAAAQIEIRDVPSGGPPPGAKPTPVTAGDERTDAILTRMEMREIRDLKAKIAWELAYINTIEDEEEPCTKSGVIWYRDDKPTAKFKVHFERKRAGSRSNKLNEQHMFDGRWYVELRDESKTLTRREIRGEGDTRNPYKLGEGAFPLPFGQRKADILREFEVTHEPPAADDPRGTDHLKLVPRRGTHSAEYYGDLHFWIVRDDPQLAGLPVRVKAGKRDGLGKINSTISVSFTDVELNSGISASAIKIDKPLGYEEVVEPLEAAAAGDGTRARRK